MNISTGIGFLLNPELPELSQLPHSLLPLVLVLVLLALLRNSLREGGGGVVAGDENLTAAADSVDTRTR